MKIRVNMNHIMNGVRGEVARCPIARAVKEHVKKNMLVNVTGSSVIFAEVNDLNQTVKVTDTELPETGQAFVRAFDDGWSLLPTELEIDIPYWARCEPPVEAPPEPERIPDLELVGV